MKLPEVLGRPPLAAAESAIVVIDMIRHQLTPGQWLLADLEARGFDLRYMVERIANTVVPNHQRLLNAARQAGARVVFLRIGSAATDLSDASRAFKPMFQVWEAVGQGEACQLIDELVPQPGDLNLLKLGSGGFTTSSLDLHLRNLGVRHVAYTGVVTNACVLATAVAGFDLGYHGYLVSDATAAFSQRLQSNSEEIISAYAEVVTTSDLLDALAGC